MLILKRGKHLAFGDYAKEVFDTLISRKDKLVGTKIILDEINNKLIGTIIRTVIISVEYQEPNCYLFLNLENGYRIEVFNFKTYEVFNSEGHTVSAYVTYEGVSK